MGFIKGSDFYERQCDEKVRNTIAGCGHFGSRMFKSGKSKGEGGVS
ncbi:hypothetical protein [Acetobacterium malicum]